MWSVTGKVSAAFAAGLVAELRSDSAPPGWTGQAWLQLWGDFQAGGWKGCDHQRIYPLRIRIHPLTSINKMHFALAFIGRNSAYKVTLKKGTERKMSAQRGKCHRFKHPFCLLIKLPNSEQWLKALPIPRASQAVTLGHTSLPPQNKPFNIAREDTVCSFCVVLWPHDHQLNADLDALVFIALLWARAPLEIPF